jgi:transcriptional regulator with XRE-family HTH domain
MSKMTGSEFKAIRESMGLSQDQLAEILCLSGKQAVSNIETEFRKPGALIAVLMRLFVELSEKRSKELRQLLIDLGASAGSSKQRRKR